MLVVMRRVGEKIIIGDEIKVAIMAIENRQVQVGIDAPKSVPVDREEIYLKKKAERSRGR